MGIGKTNRKKGHDGERLYAKIFRNLGFSHCKTARYGSRLHDDAGIDLINLPFNVQIKVGKQRGMKPSEVLQYMKDRIKELFPKENKENSNISIVIHRQEVGRGKKRTETDDIVSMTFKDFETLIKKINVWD